MLKTIKLLGTVSRSEFLLPNRARLSWDLLGGASPSKGITDLMTMMILSFAIINLSSTIGAQANTLSDLELDSRNPRKKQLVETTNSFGKNRLVNAIIFFSYPNSRSPTRVNSAEAYLVAPLSCRNLFGLCLFSSTNK